MSRNRKLAWLVFPLLISTAACGTAESNAAPVDAETAVKVVAAPAEERPMPRYLTLTGTLAANRESQVAADGMGTVADTFVERGTEVVAGAPLVRLDTRAASLTAAQARADVDATRAAVDLAKSECARADRLWAEKAINQADYDRAKAQCTQAQSQASAALARQQLAGKAVGDATVRAPFAGIVVERLVDVGEYVRPGQQVATVVEIDRLRLQLTVPETLLHRIEVGQKVVFTVTALEGETFEGTIRFVSPAVRPGSRDFIVEAEVDNHTRRLASGMFATARMATGDVTSVVVPATAIHRPERASPRVFAVVGGHLEERVVQLGPDRDGLVTVLIGVRRGDLVVTKLGAGLHDGARVQ